MYLDRRVFVMEHAQNAQTEIIRSFAFHLNILWYLMILMILLADCESPDQTSDEKADLSLRYTHMPEDTFSHGTAQSDIHA